jgi:hypothetical protein
MSHFPGELLAVALQVGDQSYPVEGAPLPKTAVGVLAAGQQTTAAKPLEAGHIDLVEIEVEAALQHMHLPLQVEAPK